MIIESNKGRLGGGGLSPPKKKQVIAPQKKNIQTKLIKKSIND